MSKLQWRTEFETGVPEIDHEHRELIDWINRTLAASSAPDVARDGVVVLLGEIYAKISAHFALEERVMKDRNYDQFAQHKRDHERLLDDIRDIMDEYESGAALDPDRFANRMTDWFGEHFRTQDARLHRSLGGS